MGSCLRSSRTCMPRIREEAHKSSSRKTMSIRMNSRSNCSRLHAHNPIEVSRLIGRIFNESVNRLEVVKIT